jgi:hypothetical protein
MIVRMVYLHPVRDASFSSKIGRNNELLHPVRDASLGRNNDAPLSPHAVRYATLQNQFRLHTYGMQIACQRRFSTEL